MVFSHILLLKETGKRPEVGQVRRRCHDGVSFRRLTRRLIKPQGAASLNFHVNRETNDIFMGM
jgi:hypothetical protein